MFAREPKRPATMGLADLLDLIPEGAVCGLGGGWLSSKPMAAVREILRRRHPISALTVLGSVDLDALAAGGLLRSARYSFASLDAFGTARAFRKAVEEGLEAQALSGFELIVGIEASARGVANLNSIGPDGEQRVIPAIDVDVALLHAAAADGAGNIGLTASPFVDLQLARAASTVLVTVERRCEHLRECGRLTGSIPRFLVDGIAVVPMGAHPTASEPWYSLDPWALAEWVRDREATLARWNLAHEEYESEVIGIERRRRLA